MIIRLDTHTHTVASDHAYSTILENAAAAKTAGLEALGMTDHAPPLEDAPRVMHFQNLHILDREIYGVKILRGIELNICDVNGGIFMENAILEKLDYSIASIHAAVYHGRNAQENTRAYICAMQNPLVKIIGHPDDGSVPVDFDALVAAAKDTNTLLEVNNYSLRPVTHRKNTRENLITMLKLCKKHAVCISLGTDAHFATAVGQFSETLSLLDETDFPEELVANTSLSKFLTLIGRKG